jgi:hypothetical protein
VSEKGREDEARATLKRLDQQSEKILTGSEAPEAPENDKIEILGKRIARILSVILAAFLILYLWRSYISG